MNRIVSRRMKDGHWKNNATYPGQVHLEMEKAGQPSRWNSLKALRILKYYKDNYELQV